MKRLTTNMLALFGTLCLSSIASAQPDPDSEPAAEPATEPVSKEAEATLRMEPKAPADDSIWRVSLAPRLGLAIPTSRLSPFVSFGLEVGYRLPALDNRLGVAVDVAYTKPSYDDSVNDPRVGGDADFQIDESELKVGLGGTFRLFGDGHDLVPWAGAALIMQRLTSTETNDLAPGENTSSDTRFGAELSFGADYKLGPGYALGEARIPLTDLDDLITGNSNAGNVNLSLGYRVVL